MTKVKKTKDYVLKNISSIKTSVKYEFHKWKKQLVVVDEIIFIAVALLFWIFWPDVLVIAVYLLLYPYLFLTARKSSLNHLYTASIVALIWMVIAKSQYGYNQEMLIVLGFNLFPLFSWAIGLFGVYIIYSHWEHIIKKTSLLKKILLFIAFYWPILIFAETIAYHVFNIHNLSTAIYAGLPICNCLHAPIWMQISYFALGPIYLIICELIGLKNPHIIRKEKL